ncbi:MAG: c-type cytochrome domain-containing protein [Verrucomicrobiota bacterium]
MQRLLPILLLVVFPEWGRSLDYETDVMPIFKEKCFNCHSDEAEKRKGDLAFDNLADMKEFYVGPYATMKPGDAEGSLLVEFVTLPDSPDAMPPPGKGDRMTEREIGILREWLDSGAVIYAKDAKDEGVAGVGNGMSIADRPLLDWKNTEGKVIKAKFLGLEGEQISLLLANGKSYRFPLAKLDEASQEQAKAQP